MAWKTACLFITITLFTGYLTADEGVSGDYPTDTESFTTVTKDAWDNWDDLKNNNERSIEQLSEYQQSGDYSKSADQYQHQSSGFDQLYDKFGRTYYPDTQSRNEDQAYPSYNQDISSHNDLGGRDPIRQLLGSSERLEPQRTPYKPPLNQDKGYPDQRQQYPDQRQQYPDQRQQYPDQRHQYPDQRQQYPDQRQQNPDQRQQYPDQRQQYPDQRHQYPDQRQQNPDQRQQYPDQRQQYPDQRHQYPDQRQQNPGQRQQYPDQRQQYPDQRQQYPDPRQPSYQDIGYQNQPVQPSYKETGYPSQTDQSPDTGSYPGQKYPDQALPEKKGYLSQHIQSGYSEKEYNKFPFHSKYEDNEPHGSPVQESNQDNGLKPQVPDQYSGNPTSEDQGDLGKESPQQLGFYPQKSIYTGLPHQDRVKMADSQDSNEVLPTVAGIEASEESQNDHQLLSSLTGISDNGGNVESKIPIPGAEQGTSEYNMPGAQHTRIEESHPGHQVDPKNSNIDPTPHSERAPIPRYDAYGRLLNPQDFYKPAGMRPNVPTSQSEPQPESQGPLSRFLYPNQIALQQNNTYPSAPIDSYRQSGSSDSRGPDMTETQGTLPNFPFQPIEDRVHPDAQDTGTQNENPNDINTNTILRPAISAEQPNPTSVTDLQVLKKPTLFTNEPVSELAAFRPEQSQDQTEDSTFPQFASNENSEFNTQDESDMTTEEPDEEEYTTEFPDVEGSESQENDTYYSGSTDDELQDWLNGFNLDEEDSESVGYSNESDSEGEYADDEDYDDDYEDDVEREDDDDEEEEYQEDGYDDEEDVPLGGAGADSAMTNLHKYPLKTNHFVENNMSLIVFYTWLGMVSFMVIITFVIVKHRQKIRKTLSHWWNAKKRDDDSASKPLLTDIA